MLCLSNVATNARKKNIMALLPQLANTPLETPLVLQLRGYFTGSLLFKYSVRRDARTFLATMSHVVGISQGGRIQRCLSTHGCSARYMQRNIPPCRWVPQAVSATPCFRPSWKEWKCIHDKHAPVQEDMSSRTSCDGNVQCNSGSSPAAASSQPWRPEG